MTTRLHGYWRSSAAYRVRIALALKGVAYDTIPVDLRINDQTAPAFLARNPQGLVPFYDDGTVATGQSLAIIDYLDETHPDPPFLPREPAARAAVRASALTIACDIHPLNNLRVLRYLKDPLGHDQAEIDAWARHWIALGLAALEAGVAHTRYLFGDTPTLADICLVPQVYNARRVETDLTPYPRLVAIDAALRDLPAFHEARPKAQADAG